jgi:hypothetical protein
LSICGDAIWEARMDPAQEARTRTGAVVAYSLELPAETPRPDLVDQLTTSLHTLRSHNAAVPVVLFLYGGRTRELDAIAGAYGVAVHEQGSYAARLAALCPAGWQALARYPLLCKYLNFGELATRGASPAFLCDCDTVFFGDVARIFERYGAADLAAREEVHSGRSHYGADRGFIDEPLLERLAAADGAAAVPPFNTGVVLVSGELLRWLAALEPVFVDYAWRFACWLAAHPATGEAAAYGELEAAEHARSLLEHADLFRALPFPSANRWILDEVALWLTLGHVPGLRTVDFDPADVAQNGEYASTDPERAPWTVCHYYSQNFARIAAWLRGEHDVMSA